MLHDTRSTSEVQLEADIGRLPDPDEAQHDDSIHDLCASTNLFFSPLLRSEICGGRHSDYTAHVLIQTQTRDYAFAVEGSLALLKNGTPALLEGIMTWRGGPFVITPTPGTLTPFGQNVLAMSAAVKKIQEEDALTFWTSGEREAILGLLVGLSRDAVKLRRKLSRIRGSFGDRVRNIRKAVLKHCNEAMFLEAVNQCQMPTYLLLRTVKEDTPFLQNQAKGDNSEGTKCPLNDLTEKALGLISCGQWGSSDSLDSTSTCPSQEVVTKAIASVTDYYQLKKDVEILHRHLNGQEEEDQSTCDNSLVNLGQEGTGPFRGSAECKNISEVLCDEARKRLLSVIASNVDVPVSFFRKTFSPSEKFETCQEQEDKLRSEQKKPGDNLTEDCALGNVLNSEKQAGVTNDSATCTSTQSELHNSENAANVANLQETQNQAEFSAVVIHQDNCMSETGTTDKEAPSEEHVNTLPNSSEWELKVISFPSETEALPEITPSVAILAPPSSDNGNMDIFQESEFNSLQVIPSSRAGLHELSEPVSGIQSTKEIVEENDNQEFLTSKKSKERDFLPSGSSFTVRALNESMTAQISLLKKAKEDMHKMVKCTIETVRDVERSWYSPQERQKNLQELYQFLDCISETVKLLEEPSFVSRLYEEDKNEIVAVLEPVFRELTGCYVSICELHDLVMVDTKYLRELVSGFPKGNLVIRDWVSDPELDAELDALEQVTDFDVDVDELFA